MPQLESHKSVVGEINIQVPSQSARAQERTEIEWLICEGFQQIFCGADAMNIMR